MKKILNNKLVIVSLLMANFSALNASEMFIAYTGTSLGADYSINISENIDYSTLINKIKLSQSLNTELGFGFNVTDHQSIGIGAGASTSIDTFDFLFSKDNDVKYNKINASADVFIFFNSHFNNYSSLGLKLGSTASIDGNIKNISIVKGVRDLDNIFPSISSFEQFKKDVRVGGYLSLTSHNMFIGPIGLKTEFKTHISSKLDKFQPLLGLGFSVGLMLGGKF